MLNIVKYEIFKVLRNKRFVFFTMVVPLGFWIFLAQTMEPNQTEYHDQFLVWLATLATTFATVGSGINTLSTRVARSKPYIRKVLVTTPYSPAKFIIVTALVQLLLNLVIEFVIIAFGMIFYGLHFSMDLFATELILLYSSVFYVLLGICLGFIFDVVTLQTISFPLYVLVMSTTITSVGFFHVPEFMTYVQRIFPGYYTNQAIASLTNPATLMTNLLIIMGYLVLVAVIAYFVYRYKSNGAVRETA
ncbi:ABC transporter permease [Paenibacillus azoreducens]|uniref:ABC transporter permease n=1 Tax=Paenibacillus azoreducens TaxID=116718 RepID=UPI0039F53ED7